MSLLRVSELSVSFPGPRGRARAVDKLTFEVEPGETLGIVGESGAGKSVACLALMGLLQTPPAHIDCGTAVFDGTDLLRCGRRQLRELRGRRIAMVFQDPSASLNPFVRVGSQISEVLRLHLSLGRKEAKRQSVEALELMGLADASRVARCYPHQLSGGMRQRAMIAMALCTRPDLLVADEPTTALDVSTQAELLERLNRAQVKTGMAMIFVSHDLGVVAGICDRVMVMYHGQAMETAGVEDLFYEPRHPYNQALQRSFPALNSEAEELPMIPGRPPSLGDSIGGCAFHPRCGYAIASCASLPPQLKAVVAGHTTACLRVQEEGWPLS